MRSCMGAHIQQTSVSAEYIDLHHDLLANIQELNLQSLLSGLR